MEWQNIKGLVAPMLFSFYMGVMVGIAGIPFDIFFRVVGVNPPLPLYVAGVIAGLLAGAIGVGVSRGIVMGLNPPQ